MSLDFSKVVSLTIPEGNVVKITRSADGTVLWDKTIDSTSKTLSTLSVGSSVWIPVNDVSTEFIVIHQGLPSTVYDPTCDGTWLLMKNIYASHRYTDMDGYLNGTFLKNLDSGVASTIKTVTLPHYSNGALSLISTKMFLLSLVEVGLFQSGSGTMDGSTLDFFITSSLSDRIAYLNDNAVPWWTRTSFITSTSQWSVVSVNGRAATSPVTNSNGVRPALILPSNTLINSDGGIIYG